MQKGWSFQKDDWDKLPKALLSASWKQAKFNSQEEKLIPATPGIYMFVTSIPLPASNRLKDIKSPIYIGISLNLKERFKQHIGIQGNGHTGLLEARACFGSNLDFLFLKIENQDNLKPVEQLLFNCFGPVVNKINSIKEGQPIAVSFGKEERL